MAFFPFPAKAEIFARAIHEFQRNTGDKKTFRINSALQELINRVAAIKPRDSPLLDISKRRIRAAKSASSHFYDTSWLTDTDKFPKTVAHFKEITANSQIIDSCLQQSITSAVTFVVATTVTAI